MNNRRFPFPSKRLAGLTWDGEAGQSLVEMALIMPLLLLMLLGVLEVGWALRGYLVLSNANREATRFSARGRYLDFNQTTPNAIGYPLVVSHTLASLAGQLPVDLYPDSTNGGIIISHYVVDTGQPCVNMSSCVCSSDPANFDAENAGNILDDDEFHGPGPSWDNYDHWRYNSRPGELESRLDDAALMSQLKNENNVFNCNLNKKDPSAPWSINSVIAVELFYDQPQLLGIFDTQSVLGVAIIPNPIPFYTHTVMRITADARTGGKSTGGLGCQVAPIALHASNLVGRSPGDTIDNIVHGSGSGNFGWLRWPSTTSAYDENYLIQEITNPDLSVSDFEDAKQSGDTLLNVGDSAWANTALSDSSAASDAMDGLLALAEMRTPVWDTADGSGSGGSYRIVGFAVVRMTGYQLAGQNSVSVEFLRWDNDSCPGNGQ
jgi:hypothetical protein